MGSTPSDRGAPHHPLKGRGALSNASGRFEQWQREALDDGWAPQEVPPLRTILSADNSRRVLAYNQSPDIPFDRSINPYRGCEHGCIYCFARPSHAWLGLSPGRDFESRILYKPDAAEVLARELAAPGYRPRPIAVGANTDAYQPAERKLGITRAVVRLLVEQRHPFVIITKSALVERDLDLLAVAAESGIASVAVSITTLDRHLARHMEPRASAPARRVETVRRLSEAGIPVNVLVAPVIPGLNDPEIESIVETASAAGACDVRYILLRLPLELKALFEEWLETHYPAKARRVWSLIRDTRGGRDYQSDFGVRMRGTGPVAALIGQRFDRAKRRLGFPGVPELACEGFFPPPAGGPGAGVQLELL